MESATRSFPHDLIQILQQLVTVNETLAQCGLGAEIVHTSSMLEHHVFVVLRRPDTCFIWGIEEIEDVEFSKGATRVYAGIDYGCYATEATNDDVPRILELNLTFSHTPAGLAWTLVDEASPELLQMERAKFLALPPERLEELGGTEARDAILGNIDAFVALREEFMSVFGGKPGTRIVDQDVAACMLQWLGEKAVKLQKD